MQATKMRTPFAIQEILGLGVGSAAAAAAAGYAHPVHHLHQHPAAAALPPVVTTPPPSTHNSSSGSSSSQPLNSLAAAQQQRLASNSSPPPAHTPNDCNNAPISPASSTTTPNRHRDSRSISPDVTRLSAAAAAAAAAAHVQLPVFNPANFYAAAGYGDHAGPLNVAAHHHHMTTLAAAAYLRGFLPPGFSTPHEFRGHFQQHFGTQFAGKLKIEFVYFSKKKVESLSKLKNFIKAITSK